jgi:LysM repeat protein
LREFVHSYPDSTKLAEAKGTLGNVNMARIFSPEESAEKVPYAVVSGDSLVRIASHFKTNAELIFRINNLETINLKIGQPLLIPQVDPSIEVDRAAGTVTLLNHGEFLKEYQVLSLKIPGKAGPVTTKVMDKLALQGSDRVAFGDKRYAGCERWVMLATNGIALRGQIEGTPTPAGILLSQPDMEEIFLLVARGTPVTIK